MIAYLARLAGWGVADVTVCAWAWTALDDNRLNHGALKPTTANEWAACATQLATLAGTVREVVRFVRSAL